MKKQKNIIISISLIITISFLLFFSKNISSDSKSQIIKTINIDLNNLPSDLQNLKITKEYFFDNKNYIIKLRSSKKEIESWINRNKKSLTQNSIIDGEVYYLYIVNNKLYKVNVANNDVKINFINH